MASPCCWAISLHILVALWKKCLFWGTKSPNNTGIDHFGAFEPSHLRKGMGDSRMLRESGSKLGCPKSDAMTRRDQHLRIPFTVSKPAWTRRCSCATCQNLHQVTLRRCPRLKPLGENLRGVRWQPSHVWLPGAINQYSIFHDIQ